MLTGRARLIVAVAILVPAVVYLGMDDERNKPVPVEIPNPAYQQSDYYIINGQIRDYSKLGALTQQLRAKQLEHQPALEQTLLIEPRLELFKPDQPTQHVSSLSGVVKDNNSVITLAGTVRLQDHQDTELANMLQTESLLIYPRSNRAETDQPVKLSSPGQTTTATGMKIDTEKGIIELLSDVKGIHHAN